MDASAIVLAFAVSGVVAPRSERRIYRVIGHAAVLGLILRELSLLQSGDAYVTIAWGFYAAGLLVVGLRLDHIRIVRAGMATLLLVVAKLFLVDVSEVEAVWRILLFLGFGGLFLILSYYLQALWRPGAGERSSS